MKKRALITGIYGQDGSYLAKFLIEKGYSVTGLASRRVGASLENLDYLAVRKNIEIVTGDMTDPLSLNKVIRDARPNEVYNLAAMSFVGASWDEPGYCAQVNAMGPLYLLEAIKSSGTNARLYQASTSEMFGNSINDDHTQNEETPFKPVSPYAFSKVFAHHAMINYRESYGMYTCNGILFNHESPIRGPEFVTRKVTLGVAKIHLDLADHIELGNLSASRDWGFAGDYVEAMWLMLQQDQPDDFVISTGISRTISDLLDEAFKAIGVDNWKPYVKSNPKFMRPKELVHLKGNSAKAEQKLGWKPTTSFSDMIKFMVDEDIRRLRKV